MMRKILVILFLLYPVISFSQIQKSITKGNIILSGGGTIQYQKDKFSDGSGSSQTTQFSVSLIPGFGYFVADNLAIGLNTIFIYSGAKDNKSYALGAGPVIKYYFNNGIFLKAEAGYSYIDNLSTDADNEKYISLMPGVGYAFFINKKVSLEPCLVYEFNNIDYNSTNNHKINSYRLELKLNIFL
jgi:hypothetical protein